LSKTYVGTNITATTVKGVGRINKVRGFCKQETREGYNLVDFSEWVSTHGSTASFSNDILTVASTGDIQYPYVAYVVTNLILNNPNKIMRFQCEKYDFTNGNKPDIQLQITDTNDKTTWHSLLSVGGVYSNYNIPSDISNIKAVKFRVVPNNTSTTGEYSISITKPMLLFGTEEKPYEPYGAMPSLNFPSKVHCLGDDVNLYDKATETVGELIDTSGAIKVNANFTHSDYIRVNSNEAVSVIFDKKSNGQIVIIEYDINKSFIKGNFYNFTNTSADNKYTITTRDATAYIIAEYRNDLNMGKIKVCKGTVATQWSPYGCGSVTNKSETINKYNKDTEVQGLVNTSTGAIQNNSAWRASDFITINAQKYTFAWESTSDYFQVNYNLYDINKNFINSVSLTQWGIYLKTFKITNQSAKYLKVCYSVNANNIAIARNNIMLLEGEYTTANLPDYVPHEEDEQTTYIKEPLYGIGGVYDELDLTAGKIIRRFAKKVLDGTESWKYENGVFINTTVLANAKLDTTWFKVSNIMCNKYKAVLFNTLSNYDCALGAMYVNQQHRLDIRNSNFTNVEDFKNDLQLYPAEIIYELAEPVIEHIDCSDKIAQFDGQTNIYNTDGAELECTLTNNRAIAQINQNLQKIEDMIFSIKAGGE